MKILLFVLLGILSVAFLLILFPLILTIFVGNKERKKDSKFCRKVVMFYTNLAYVILRVRVKVLGKEKLNGISRALLVQNHISGYDPISTWKSLGFLKLAFLTKEENLKVFLFGRIVKRLCFKKIDRVDPRKAIITINEASELLKKGEVSIGVYPEGTRSKTGELLPFHDGIFKIAKKANAPIIVTIIKNTPKIKKNIPFRKTVVIIEIVDVISSETVERLDSHELGGVVREKMLTALNK